MAENWTDDELKASVEAYAKMAALEAARKPYSKRQIYLELVGRFGRTVGAFDYRMQNISAVLDEIGKSWVPGLRPAGNVGANVKARIIAFLEQGWKDARVASSTLIRGQ